MPARYGDWIQTYTGKQFWPLDPRVDEIDIADIAHALSNICRFNGHCREFYSVAQHSVLVSQQCGPKDALWGLLHDAAEAYLGDMVTPLKRSTVGPGFCRAEARLCNMIAMRFDLPYDTRYEYTIPTSVRYADARLLATEARDLMAPPPVPWENMKEPYAWRIEPWSPRRASVEFTLRFGGVA